MKAEVAAFNQEKALVGSFSVITNLRMRRGSVLVSVAPLSPPQVPVPGLQLTGSGQRGPGRGRRGPTLVHAGAAAPSNHWDPLKI